MQKGSKLRHDKVLISTLVVLGFMLSYSVPILANGMALGTDDLSTLENANSAPVEEVFNGQTIWKGDVEIFDITGHPKAKRCYAWSHDSDTGKTRYQAVLELPPVDSPETAGFSP